MKFLQWLADSPIASAFKIGSAAALVWVIDNVSSLEIPAVMQVSLVAGIPVIVNWLNPEDTRYGKKSGE